MSIAIKENVLLKEYTTLQVGGPASYFAEVTSEQELDEVITFAKTEGLPVTVLGGGSNVLVSDGGITGLVIKMAIDDEPQLVPGDGQEVLVTATAGTVLDTFVAWTVEKGLWGIENLSHIPGSVGATPVQNVGAYGVEVKDVIDTVRVYNLKEQRFEMLTAHECQFAYRDSVFKHAVGSEYIVTAVTYKLSTEATPVLGYRDLADRFAEVHKPSQAEIRAAVIEIRDKKFPDWHTVGTAGSFFKNPVITEDKLQALLVDYPHMPHFPAGEGMSKIPLGWVLDKVLNLKGAGSDKVGQYEGQALVLINKGEATAAEIESHASGVVNLVREKIDVSVEWEVTKVGF